MWAPLIRMTGGFKTPAVTALKARRAGRTRTIRLPRQRGRVPAASLPPITFEDYSGEHNIIDIDADDDAGKARR